MWTRNLYDYCGHQTTSGEWTQTEVVSVPGLCRACRTARIGEIIAFVRYGKPPTSGVSRNHRDGTDEQGVSVYELVNGAPRYVGWYFEIVGRPEYRGVGTIVGWGSDGEPLVRIQKISRARRTRA